MILASSTEGSGIVREGVIDGRGGSLLTSGGTRASAVGGTSRIRTRRWASIPPVSIASKPRIPSTQRCCRRSRHAARTKSASMPLRRPLLNAPERDVGANTSTIQDGSYAKAYQ